MTKGRMLLLVCAATFLACGEPEAVKIADGISLPGWRPEGKTEVYESATLYRYIDGGAELYLAHGFVALASRTFTKGEEYLAIDIYEMKDAEAGKAIYDDERAPEYDYLSDMIGYTAEGMLYFHRDRYYVKISTGQIPKAELLSVAKQVAALLP